MQLNAKTYTLLVAALAALTSAAPSKDIRAAAGAISGGAAIKWKGKLFAERDEYTLYGDAKSIYHQQRDINPDYDPADFGDALVKRDFDLHKRAKNGGNCGGFSTGAYADLGPQAVYLQNLGGTCGVDAGPGACSRISCKNTSAWYLCNDNDSAIAPLCSYIGSYASDIFLSCGTNSLFSANPTSGQEFDTDGYSVVGGFGNCDDSVNTVPSSYQMPGPNGDPVRTCSNCVSVAVT